MAKKSKDSQKSRAAELRAEREAAARKAERRTRMLIAAAVVVGVGIVGGAFFFANQAETDSSAAVPAGVVAPDGGAPVGEAGAPVVVDEWFDFECPHCADAHTAFGPTVDELVDAGEIQMSYHPLAFVKEPGSSLAANAFGCAVDAGMTEEFRSITLESQSAEGFTNEQLIELGAEVGLTDDSFAECVENGTFEGWVENVKASQLVQTPPVSSTPTFFFNGQVVQFTILTPEAFVDAVEAAKPAGEDDADSGDADADTDSDAEGDADADTGTDSEGSSE